MGVTPTLRNVQKSIDKLNIAPVLEVNPAAWYLGMRRTEQQLEPSLTQPLTFEVRPDPHTSATFPFTVFGFKNKGEVLSFPEFWEWFWKPWAHPCITRVSGKVEYLSIHDIRVEQKIRTFLVCCLTLILWQFCFTKLADAAMMRFNPGGIRYGYVFQFGGFHALMKQYEGYFVHTWDVKGYDRRLPLMSEVWRLRLKYIRIPDWAKPYARWVARESCQGHILLPNGDVVFCAHGNKSGSGSTTGDNCISHLIIKNYLDALIEIGRNVYLDTKTSIYSDDIISAYRFQLDEAFVKMVYSHFGYEIQDFQVTYGPVGIAFLGARCFQKEYYGERYYLPAYDSARIYASLVQKIKKQTVDEEIMKAYALLHLAIEDHSLFHHIRDFLIAQLQDEHNNGTFVVALRKSGIPSLDQVCLGFWLGFESEFLMPESLDFSLVQKEVGGF